VHENEKSGLVFTLAFSLPQFFLNSAAYLSLKISRSILALGILGT
jgi:hypothetical protein